MSLIHPSSDSRKPASKCTHWRVGDALKIGTIIDSNGQEVQSLVLEPQGIAHLISKECIKLDENVCGFAHVLTGKCNQGLLTLNIGVIDPGWNDYISTAILNFSAERRLLQVNEEFIRVTYHRIDYMEDFKYADAEIKPADEFSYTRGVRNRAVGDFGKHFLNIKQLVSKASKKENIKLRDAMLKFIPIAAFSLAFFALLVTIGIASVTRIAGKSDSPPIINIPAVEAENRSYTESEIADLKKRIEFLEKQPAQSQPVREQAGNMPTEPVKTDAVKKAIKE